MRIVSEESTACNDGMSTAGSPWGDLMYGPASAAPASNEEVRTDTVVRKVRLLRTSKVTGWLKIRYTPWAELPAGEDTT